MTFKGLFPLTEVKHEFTFCNKQETCLLHWTLERGREAGA
jgi:hypothetical protein